MKKNIYFVQAIDVYDAVKKSVCIPYAVGCIQAYCQKNDVINNHYNFGKFIYIKEDIQDIVSRLDNPYMVLFSCSIWNTEYNKALAKAVKAKYPSCLITFGGHNVSPDGSELEKYEYIDFITHRFGEEPTEELLVNLALNLPLNEIGNISFRDADGTKITTKYKNLSDTCYPSPYLEGTFDEILKDDIIFSAIFETTRGCPNSCAFCDWSELASKVTLFPLEKVKAELDWFVEHKIEYIFCVDANFGLFDRDQEIADYVIHCKETFGYPQVFRVFFTKNNIDAVFDISTKFFKSGLDRAKPLSFQSLNPEVLKNIGRKNIPIEFFKELLQKYNKLNMNTLAEIILGLPGETYESFCNGVNVLLEIGQHFAIEIYPCELFPNSRLSSKAYKEKFKIKSTRIPFKLIHTIDKPYSESIPEYSEYVTSTSTMNESEWQKSFLFANYIQGFHNFGSLRSIAIYICNEHKITYSEFYQKFIDWSCKHTGTVLNTIYNKMNSLCGGIVTGKNETLAIFPGINGIYWRFDEIVHLNFLDNIDKFYSEVKSFIADSFESSGIIDELFKYQYGIMKKMDSGNISVESEYDFYTYFNNIYSGAYKPLEKKRTVIEVYDHITTENITDYAIKVLWYGRAHRATDYTSACYQKKFKEAE